MGVIGEFTDGIDWAKKQPFMERILDWFSRPNVVAVLGSTGTGKTQLIRSLQTDLLPAVVKVLDRTEFGTRERAKLGVDGVKFVLVDTPGQVGHAERRMRELQKHLSPNLGIINVTAFGYHQYRTEALPPIADNHVDPAWLERHRAIEIQQLDEWTGVVGARDSASWLITVASKADLWWSRRSEVYRHYNEGAYRAALEKCAALRPVVVEHASICDLFYDTVPFDGTFGDRQRAEQHGRLVDVLLQAVSGNTP